MSLTLSGKCKLKSHFMGVRQLAAAVLGVGGEPAAPAEGGSGCRWWFQPGHSATATIVRRGGQSPSPDSHLECGVRRACGPLHSLLLQARPPGHRLPGPGCLQLPGPGQLQPRFRAGRTWRSALPAQSKAEGLQPHPRLPPRFRVVAVEEAQLETQYPPPVLVAFSAGGRAPLHLAHSRVLPAQHGSPRATSATATAP